MTQSKVWIFASVALVGLAEVVLAQNSGVTRTVVTKADVSVPNREAVEARVEIAPGGVVGWHTHPGDEVSYVTDGEITLLVAGQPPRKVVAGEGYDLTRWLAGNQKRYFTIRDVTDFVSWMGVPSDDTSGCNFHTRLYGFAIG